MVINPDVRRDLMDQVITVGRHRRRRCRARQGRLRQDLERHPPRRWRALGIHNGAGLAAPASGGPISGAGKHRAACAVWSASKRSWRWMDSLGCAELTDFAPLRGHRKAHMSKRRQEQTRPRPRARRSWRTGPAQFRGCLLP